MSSRLQKAPSAPLLGLVGPAAPQAGATFFPDSDPVQAGKDAANALLPPAEPAPERKEKIGGWNSVKGTYERLRRAQWHTQTQPDGWESISALVDAVVVAEVERLEREHNGGEPFPEIPPGRMKRSSRR